LYIDFEVLAHKLLEETGYRSQETVNEVFHSERVLLQLTSLGDLSDIQFVTINHSHSICILSKQRYLVYAVSDSCTIPLQIQSIESKYTTYHMIQDTVTTHIYNYTHSTNTSTSIFDHVKNNTLWWNRTDYHNIYMDCIPTTVMRYLSIGLSITSFRQRYLIGDKLQI
jgi:hypothetical protein